MQGALGQSQSKPPSWSSGATGEFSPEKWGWLSHKTNVNPFLLCGKSASLPLKLRESQNRSFAYKGTAWDGEGILQQSRTVYFQECHLLSAQAARGSSSSSSNKAVSLEHSAVADKPSFPDTNRFPSPWPESASATNIWVSHTSNCSLLPLSCNRENEWFKCMFEMFYLQGNGSRHHPLCQCKTICPNSIWITFWLVLIKQISAIHVLWALLVRGAAGNSNSQSCPG